MCEIVIAVCDSDGQLL